MSKFIADMDSIMLQLGRTDTVIAPSTRECLFARQIEKNEQPKKTFADYEENVQKGVSVRSCEKLRHEVDIFLKIKKRLKNRDALHNGVH